MATNRSIPAASGWVLIQATTDASLLVDIESTNSAPVRIYVGPVVPGVDETVGFVLTPTEPSKRVNLEVGESAWGKAVSRSGQVTFETSPSAVPGLANLAVAIANAASLSAALDLGAARVARIAMPSAWTAADLTFMASYDGVNFNDLYDASGNEYLVKAAASRSIILPLADFYGIRHLKVRSGTSALPVNQGAARTLQLVLVN